jgi:putative membrane protein
MKRPSRLPRALTLAAGSALVLFLALDAGWNSVADVLVRLGLSGLLIVSVIHLPIIALLGLAWWIIGGNELRAAPLPFITARLVRDSVGEALPLTQIGGFAAGLRMLYLKGVQASRGAASLFADLVAEFVAKILYLAIGLTALALAVPVSQLPRSLMTVGTITIVAVLLWYVLRARIGRLLRAGVKALQKRYPQLQGQDPVSFLTDRRLLPAFVLHLVCWLAGAFETWVIFNLLGVPISWAGALIIDSLVSGLRTLGFLVPAAAGVQEASYVFVSLLIGIPPATSVAASLVRRARDLLIAMPGLTLWQVTEQQMAFSSRVSANAARKGPPMIKEREGETTV